MTDDDPYLYNNVPLATPYPWGPHEQLASYNNNKKRKLVVVGSGYAALYNSHHQLLKPRSKRILETLLSRHGKDNDAHNNNDDITAAHNVMHDAVAAQILPSSSTTITTQEEKSSSLFWNILKVISSSPSSPVSTRHVLRTCALSVSCQWVPPEMDCKEMVLAALYFLSSECKNHLDSDDVSTITSLPLIQSVGIVTPDLEKRAFEKQGEWSLANVEFAKGVAQLEHLFYKSASSPPYKLLGRVRFCPRGFSQQEERQLLFKGTMPAKSRKASDALRKRKASTSRQPTPTPATTPSTFFGFGNDTMPHG